VSPAYEARPLPEDVMSGPEPLWGVMRVGPKGDGGKHEEDWVRDPGDRTPLWFVTGTLAGMYAEQLASCP
jgi:hypothetical protein